MEENIKYYPVYVPFITGRYRVHPNKLKTNCYDLGFFARCGNCNYENTLGWNGKKHTFCYDIICPNCGYGHKID